MTGLVWVATEICFYQKKFNPFNRFFFYFEQDKFALPVRSGKDAEKSWHADKNRNRAGIVFFRFL